MRILSVSALFPPNVIGGAEMSAYNLAKWMIGKGHQMGVLTTARNASQEARGELVDGLYMYRVEMPRLYPTIDFPNAPAWKKPLWHLQDYLDPRNRRVVAEVLEDFKPDLALVHFVPGLGYNGLAELGLRDVPVVYFLHDLGLACARMSMFRNGASCEHQCALCHLSSRYKQSIIDKIPRLGFCSPSRANLHRVADFVPIRRRPSTSILNANRYPAPSATRTDSKTLRLLYVGRLHSTKGVDLLLDAAERVHQQCSDGSDLTVTVVGGGPDETALRARYGGAPWCRFTGFVPQAEVANIMLNSDLLCVPSIWFENSPGVLVQALGIGLPALASNIGGMPELVEDGRNGMLVPAGDGQAWEATISGLLADRTRLVEWRRYALANAYKFDQDYLGNQIMEFAEQVIRQPISRLGGRAEIPITETADA